MKRITLALLALLAVFGGVLTACADADDEVTDPQAQPAPDVTVFASGDFGEIPVMPLSEPLQERTRDGDVVAQSFEIRNRSIEQIFEFYSDALEPVWQPVEEPAPLTDAETAAWRGRWSNDDQRLTVSVSHAPTVPGNPPGASDDPVLQYSLLLEPLGAVQG